MKVILLKDVKSLGCTGDVVEVSDGHARNFLFPQQAAVQATTEELRRKAKRETIAEKKKKNEMSNVEKLAQQLKGYELIIFERTNQEGVLYAAVTAKKIVKTLAGFGFKIKTEMISISEPIKGIGRHKINIEFSHSLKVPVWIIVKVV